MNTGENGKGWERTNVTNLLRNGESGIYYARVKSNGKQRWRSLKTSVFSVAKLRLGDFEKVVRAQSLVEKGSSAAGNGEETSVARFVAILRSRTANNSAMAPNTKARREIALKALLKTWPGLASKDARRVTPTEAQEWAGRALREGTGFVAPNARTIRRGMSPGAFNKCQEILRAIFKIAKEHGAAYSNPADSVTRAKVRKTRLELPSGSQFQAILKSIAEAGARQSKDCAHMAKLLAFSGVRLEEANSLRWRHIDSQRGRITVPGTKSETSFRDIPIFAALSSLFDEIAVRRANLGMHTRPDDPILAVNECKGALATACRSVGVKRLTHHSLRHFFATRCIESGVDIPTVSRWLGHSDGGALAMRTYGHLRQEHSDSMAAKVSF